VRDTTFKERGSKTFCSGLKVSRKCPFVLLVEVYLRESEALGSDKV
jgi:hypothetical protein